MVIANDVSYVTNEDVAITMNILTDDNIYKGGGDSSATVGTLSLSALDMKVVQKPKSGILKKVNVGSYTYIPNSNFNGMDHFVYKIFDNSGETDTATGMSSQCLINIKRFFQNPCSLCSIIWHHYSLCHCWSLCTPLT